jgi:hypothetical protein
MTHNLQLNSVVSELSWTYTNDEHRYMLSSFGAWNTGAGNHAMVHALRYCQRLPARRYCGWTTAAASARVTPTVLVNAGRPRPARTPTNLDAIIAAA